MAAGSPTLMPLRNCEFCPLAVPRATIAPCRPPDVPPTSGRLEMRPGTLYSASAQMSRPPGVLCSSCWLSVTLTLALVVSTMGDSPDTVTVSATAATFSVISTGVVWPTLTTRFSRMVVWNPPSSTFTA